MFRHDRCACLLLGLAALAGFLPTGVCGRRCRSAGIARYRHRQRRPRLCRSRSGSAASTSAARRSSRGSATRRLPPSGSSAARRAPGPNSGRLQKRRRTPGSTTRSAGADLPLPAGGRRGGRREGRPSAEIVVRIGVVTLRPPRRPELGRLPGARRRDRPEVVGARGRGRHRLEHLPQESPGDGVPARRLLAQDELPRHRARAGTACTPTCSPRWTRRSARRPCRGSCRSGFTRPPATPGPQRPAVAWRVRRTRLVALVDGGEGSRSAAAGGRRRRAADAGTCTSTDSGRNLVFVFSAAGRLPAHARGGAWRGKAFKNVLGLAIDRDENLFVVDAGAGTVQGLTRRGAPAAASTCRARRAGSAG